MDLRISSSAKSAPRSSSANEFVPLPAEKTKSAQSEESLVAQSVPVPTGGNDPSSVARSHRALLANLETEARTIGFNPLDAAQSALRNVGRATGLFDVPMSPQQRVGFLMQVYDEAIARFEEGDPRTPRWILGELHSVLNEEITAIKNGRAQTATLGFRVGAGVAEFVRSTSVGLSAGVGALIGGPPTGALAGGLQSLGTIGIMTATAAAQGVPLEQLDLPNKLIGDVGNIFTSLAGPKLLAFFGLPGAPTANTMGAIGAHMGRMGLIDGGLDGLFVTVAEASVKGTPIPEALRVGATQGLISFFASGAFSGPTGFLDARKQSQMVEVVRQMNPGEARRAVGALDAGTANRMRNEQPMIFRALDEQSGGGLTALTGRGSAAPSGAGAPRPSGGAPLNQPGNAVPGNTVSGNSASGTPVRLPDTSTVGGQQPASRSAPVKVEVARSFDDALNFASTANRQVAAQNISTGNGASGVQLDVTVPVRGTFEGKPVDFTLRGSPLELANEVVQLKRKGIVPSDFDVGRAAAQADAPWTTLLQTELNIRANNLEVRNRTTLFGSTVGVEVDAGEAMRRVQEINARGSGADAMALYAPLETNIVGSEGVGGLGRTYTYYVNTPDKMRGFFDAMVDQGRLTVPSGQTRDQFFQELLEQSGVGRSFPGRLDAAQDIVYGTRLPAIGGRQPSLVTSEELYQKARSRARNVNEGVRDAFIGGDGSGIDRLALVVPGTGDRGAFADNLSRGEVASLLNTMQEAGLVRSNVSLEDIIAANRLEGLVGVENGRAVALDPNRTIASAPSRPGASSSEASSGASQSEAPGGGGSVPPKNPRTGSAGADDPGAGGSGRYDPNFDRANNLQTIRNIETAPYDELSAWINDSATFVEDLPVEVRQAAARRLASAVDDRSLPPRSLENARRAFLKLTDAPTHVTHALPGNPERPRLPEGSAPPMEELRLPSTETSGSASGSSQHRPNDTSAIGDIPSNTASGSGSSDPSLPPDAGLRRKKPGSIEEPSAPQIDPLSQQQVETQPSPTARDFAEPDEQRLDLIPGPFLSEPDPLLDMLDPSTNNGIRNYSPVRPRGTPLSQDYGLEPDLPYVGESPIGGEPIFQQQDGSLVSPPPYDEILLEPPGTIANQGHVMSHTNALEIIGRTRVSINLGVVSVTMWLQTGDPTTAIAREAREAILKVAKEEGLDLTVANPSNLAHLAHILDKTLPQSMGFFVNTPLRRPETGMFARSGANFGEYIEIKRDRAVNAGAVIYDETAGRGGRYRLNTEDGPDGTRRLRHPLTILAGDQIFNTAQVGAVGIDLFSVNAARLEEQTFTLPAGYEMDPQLANAIEAGLNNPLTTMLWRHSGQPVASGSEKETNLTTVNKINFSPRGMPSVTEDPFSVVSAYPLPKGWENLHSHLPGMRPPDGHATTTYMSGGAGAGGISFNHQIITRWVDMDPMLNPSAIPNQTPNWNKVGPVWTIAAGEDGALSYTRNPMFEAAIQKPGVSPPDPSTKVWVQTPREDFTMAPFAVVKAMAGEDLSNADLTEVNLWVRERVRREARDGTVKHPQAFGAISGGAEQVRIISENTRPGEPLTPEARAVLAPFFERLIHHEP